MWGWEARSREELHKRLKAIPDDVPARCQGRKAEHVERYVICDVVWTLAIAAAVRHKIGKLNGPTFRRQDRNWLAVTTTLRSRCGISAARACTSPSVSRRCRAMG